MPSRCSWRTFPPLFQLVIQLQSKLQDTRVGARRGNRTEALCVGKVEVARGSKFSPVSQVECLGAEFNLGCFPDREILEERHVEVLQARSAHLFGLSAERCKVG